MNNVRERQLIAMAVEALNAAKRLVDQCSASMEDEGKSAALASDLHGVIQPLHAAALQKLVDLGVVKVQAE